jgi:hypothetical protein
MDEVSKLTIYGLIILNRVVSVCKKNDVLSISWDVNTSTRLPSIWTIGSLEAERTNTNL